MIDKELINEVKNSVNIIDIIGETVALSKTGRNYLGLCPFHSEKTPSFNVVEDKQFYHCFGCGKSGDVFKFIEDYRGVSFIDAVQIVAEQSGISLPDEDKGQEIVKHNHPHQKLYDIHTEAAKFYHAVLMTTNMGEEARQYLYQRGLTDDVLRHFQIGLAPSEGNYLYQKVAEQFDENTIANSGLFHLSETNLFYDAFQNRIIFPLTNEFGQVVAFSGRIWKQPTVDDKHVPKYKNSRATAIFNKSYELYHLDKAKPTIKKNHEVYLMEGFMDVIAAYRVGIENVVASMGTALTREHVEHLRKYTKKVILSYDGDNAGQNAIVKSLDELKGFNVEIVKIPDNMDPDEFLQKNSSEDLQTLLTKNRISNVEFLLHYLKPDNIENLQAQIDFVEKMVPIIAKTKSITAQHSYIYMLADLLSAFDYQQIEQLVNNHHLADRQQQSQSRQVQGTIPLSNRLSRLIKAENHIFYRMIQDPLILNQYRLRTNFNFETPELQILYKLLLANGEVTSQDLSELPENVQKAWYRILEENLPEDMEDGELKEVETIRQRELLQKNNQEIGKNVKEAAYSGDMDRAILEMQRLIEQKRRME